ncbi:hypothetical protein ACFQE1_16125, partial [Halobium palmae]
ATAAIPGPSSNANGASTADSGRAADHVGTAAERPPPLRWRTEMAANDSYRDGRQRLPRSPRRG